MLCSGGACIKHFHETRSCDKLCSPGGMVVDTVRERLVIADTGSHRVICIDISRASLELVQPLRVWQHGAAFNRGCADDLLSSPCGCAPSLDGLRVHVADSLNHRIVTLCAETGAFLGAFGARGPLAGQFNGPRSIAVSPIDGRVWIADSDNQRVVCFEENIAAIDQEPWRFVAQLGRAESSEASHDRFDHPRSVAISSDGALLAVADTYNHRVQIFESKTHQYVRTIDTRADGPAAVAALGNGSAAAAVASTSPANARPLESPRIVCLHGDDLYVCTKDAESPLCVFSVSTGAWRGAVSGKMSALPSSSSSPIAVSAVKGVQWSGNVLGLCSDTANGTLFVSDSVASSVAMLHALC